jgi:hypothetical protein
MGILSNPKHETVAQSLAKGMGICEAYVAGGFKRSPVSASKFCAKPEIKVRVAEIRELRERLALEHEVATSADVARKLGITKTKIIEALWQNAQRCLNGVPLLDEAGKPTGKFAVKPDAAGASRALQLIGMECFTMFVERHEVGNPGDFARLTDEELSARVEADAEALGFDPKATAVLLSMFRSEVKH